MSARYHKDVSLNTGVKVPSSRIARLASLGSLVTRVAGGMVAEGLNQLASGNLPTVNGTLLTTGNVNRVTDQLARLRGAAMKVGQLLSMDAGEVLPEQLSQLLERLRADAEPMPVRQLQQVLEQEWGPNWSRDFSHFSLDPVAAASIGQVHAAFHRNGQHLAVKIQYPGIKASIDSDVDNVITLLSLAGLLPKGLEYDRLTRDAKRQLHDEADYRREAAQLENYQGFLCGSDQFVLPEVSHGLSTSRVLAMSFIGGEPIDALIRRSQAERDRAVGSLFKLLFRELFEFRLIQSDPNFANYRYQPKTQQIVLLDFGATHEIDRQISDAYLRLIEAALDGDEARQLAVTDSLQLTSSKMSPHQRQLVLRMIHLVRSLFAQDSDYDFGRSTVVSALRQLGMQLAGECQNLPTPPIDVLMIHRKLAGMYLLATKLKVRVNLSRLLAPYL